MTFTPGKSGNPQGRNLERIFSELFRLVGNDIDVATSKRKARRLAETVYKLALEGDLTAAQMIMDRVDGKPMQATEVTIMQRTTVDQFSDAELMALIAQEKSDKERKPDDAPLQ